MFLIDQVSAVLRCCIFQRNNAAHCTRLPKNGKGSPSPTRPAVTSVARRGRAVTPFDDKLKRRACPAPKKRAGGEMESDSPGVKCILKTASKLSAPNPLPYRSRFDATPSAECGLPEI